VRNEEEGGITVPPSFVFLEYNSWSHHRDLLPIVTPHVYPSPPLGYTLPGAGLRIRVEYFDSDTEKWSKRASGFRDVRREPPWQVAFRRNRQIKGLIDKLNAVRSSMTPVKRN
jgi:hypothetical protein